MQSCQLMPLAASAAALPYLLPHVHQQVKWVCKCLWFSAGGGALCTCSLTLCMYAWIHLHSTAIRKTSFTASLKLARGSPQDVHTPELPAVNRLNSVSLNSPSLSLFYFYFFAFMLKWGFVFFFFFFFFFNEVYLFCGIFWTAAGNSERGSK